MVVWNNYVLPNPSQFIRRYIIRNLTLTASLNDFSHKILARNLSFVFYFSYPSPLLPLFFLRHIFCPLPLILSFSTSSTLIFCSSMSRPTKLCFQVVKESKCVTSFLLSRAFLFHNKTYIYIVSRMCVTVDGFGLETGLIGLL